MRTLLSCILLLVGITGGACSGLEVGRMGMGEEGSPKGIPYRLTTSTFVIKVDPPTGTGVNPTYTLNQLTMPDPKQGFWINAKPAFLTKTSFKLTLGQNGELSSTSTLAEEQIIPTMKAIGEFAVTALGVAAKVAAAADQGADLAELTKWIISEDCRSISLMDPFKQRYEDWLRCEMKASMMSLKSPQNLAERFYYKSPSEQKWLKEASAKVGGKVTSMFDSPEYSKAISNCNEDPTCKGQFNKIDPVVERELGQAIQDSIRQITPESVDRILVQVDRDKEIKTACSVQKELDESSKKACADDAKSLNLLKQIVSKAVKMQKDWADYQRDQKIFDRLADLPSREWRHRRALDIEDKILEHELRLIQAGTIEEPEELKKDRKELARIIGGVTETERANALRDLLLNLGNASSQIISQDRRGVGIMEEYQRARQELETVLGVLKVKRDALRPDRSSSQLVSREVTSRPLWWKERSTAEKVRRELLLDPDVKQLPEFVIVIERGMAP